MMSIRTAVRTVASADAALGLLLLVLPLIALAVQLRSGVFVGINLGRWWQAIAGAGVCFYVAHGLWTYQPYGRKLGIILSGIGLAMSGPILLLLLASAKARHKNADALGIILFFALIALVQLVLLTTPAGRDLFRKPSTIPEL